MDGVAGVTQCAIPPGSSFIYNVSIPADQSGTFWYHAHAGLARADGLYGGLVVHAPAREANVASEDKHEKDMLLLIGDWYHQPAEEVMEWYMQPASFGNEVRTPLSLFTRQDPFSNRRKKKKQAD